MGQVLIKEGVNFDKFCPKLCSRFSPARTAQTTFVNMVNVDL